MTERLTITLSDELAAQARAAAERNGSSVSGWLADAVAAHLRHEALGDFLRAWTDEAGPVPREDVEAVAAELGWASPDAPESPGVAGPGQAA